MTKKIIDNPSIKDEIQLVHFLEKTFKLLDKVPFVYKLPKLKFVRNEFRKIEDSMNTPLLPDEFNALFSKNGWICFESLSIHLLEKAVELGKLGNHLEANNLLIEHVDEKFIDLILLKCRTRDHFIKRHLLIKLAKIDYLENRHHACIPLLLALIDGLANDVSKHIGFFTDGLNLEMEDSISAHPTGLPFLKQMMNTTVKITYEEKITIPYRNGILHGRELNFAHKEVSAKCWWTLAALIDWADKVSNPYNPEPKLTLTESINKHQQTLQLIERINKWEKHPNFDISYWEKQTLETLPIESPEYAVLSFFHFWKNKKWKLIDNLLPNWKKRLYSSIIKLKKDYENVEIVSCQIIEREDLTPSMTLVTVRLEVIENNEVLQKQYRISLQYLNKEGHATLRNEPKAEWKVIPAAFSELYST